MNVGAILALAALLCIWCWSWWFCSSHEAFESKGLEENGKRSRIVVSMTTIPDRIEKNTIEATLQSLSKQTMKPDIVYIHVPPKSLAGTPYPVAKLETLVKHYAPWVHVNRVPEDLGPITKVVPVLSLVHDNDYIILIDDDVAYDDTMIEKLMSSRDKSAAVGFAGRTNLSYQSGDFYEGPCEFLETYGGVMYQASVLRGLDDYKTTLGSTCEKQDDIVLGKHVASKGVVPWILPHKVPGTHDAQGTTELRNENLGGGGQNETCYRQLFA